MAELVAALAADCPWLQVPPEATSWTERQIHRFFDSDGAELPSVAESQPQPEPEARPQPEPQSQSQPERRKSVTEEMSQVFTSMGSIAEVREGTRCAATSSPSPGTSC